MFYPQGKNGHFRRKSRSCTFYPGTSNSAGVILWLRELKGYARNKDFGGQYLLLHRWQRWYLRQAFGHEVSFLYDPEEGTRGQKACLPSPNSAVGTAKETASQLPCLSSQGFCLGKKGWKRACIVRGSSSPDYYLLTVYGFQLNAQGL